MRGKPEFNSITVKGMSVIMKFLIIRPIVSSVANEIILSRMKPFVSSDVILEAVKMEEGPTSIECRQDIALAQPGILKAVADAQDKDYDGCLISCFADPGLEAAREISRIPVVAPGQAGMLLAHSLGSNVGIVTVASALIPVLCENSKNYGLNNVVGINAVDIPVVQLDKTADLAGQLAVCGERLVREKGADVIVLGCTGMVGLAEQVEKLLADKGYKLPVIDPVGAALGLLESIVRVKVRHSPLKYGLSPKEYKI